MEDERPEYVLGMAPEEIARLERQHAAWRDTTLAVCRLAGFEPGQTVIDLGSGPGFAAVELARIVGPAGRVIAVDSSATALAQCRRLVADTGLANVDVVAGDAASFDASSWQADAVFARWLFSYLAEPEAAVQALAAGLRPGATVAVMDYWNYLSIQTEPRSPLFAGMYQAVYESVRDTGGSFNVAGRLPSLFGGAGLRVTEVEVFSRVGRPGSELWAWLGDFQRLYLPSLVARGYLAQAELTAFSVWWEELSSNASALLFAPPVLAVVAVKER